MKKRFICLLAALFVLLLCPLTVYADDYSDYSDNWQTNAVDNTIAFYKGVAGIAKKVLSGDISVAEAVINIESIAVTTGIDNTANVFKDIATGDFSLMSPKDFAVYLINSINNAIKDGGGEVSSFPIENGYYKIGDYTIATFSFGSRSAATSAGFPGSSYWGRDDVPYSAIGVFTSDGNMFYGVNLGSEGRPSDPGTLQSVSINGFDLIGTYDDFDHYRVNYTVTYVAGGVTRTKNTYDYIRVPPGSSDSGFEFVTESPDVGDLPEDDLIKYIDNMIDRLEQVYPDLSTIEGKLQEIINLLNKSKNGDCSCDELAAAVRELIAKLDTNGTDSELSNTLKELTKILDNNQDLTPVIDKIDELQKALLKVYAFDYSDDDIKAVKSKYDDFADYLISKKFAFIVSLRSMIDTAVKSYKSSSDNTSFTVTFNGYTHTINLASSFSSEQLNLYRYMIAAFLYVRYAFATYRRIPAYINNGGDK